MSPTTRMLSDRTGPATTVPAQPAVVGWNSPLCAKTTQTQNIDIKTRFISHTKVYLAKWTPIYRSNPGVFHVQ